MLIGSDVYLELCFRKRKTYTGRSSCYRDGGRLGTKWLIANIEGFDPDSANNLVHMLRIDCEVK